MRRPPASLLTASALRPLARFFGEPVIMPTNTNHKNQRSPANQYCKIATRHNPEVGIISANRC